MVWGVVGLLMGRGVQTAKVRLGAVTGPRVPDEEKSELIAMLPFLALGHRWP